MASVRFANVSFAYPHQSRLLENLTFDLESGWTGLVGANGSGKSTLLRLLQGALSPTAGEIHRGSWKVVSCPQLLERTEAVQRFANAWTRDSLRWISLLELEPERFFEGGLSPGLERRWQIAASLHEEPGLLLLDEPTNHLDDEARRVLVQALHAFEGIGLVCSHDRLLLDELTVRTLRVNHGSVTLYPGCYSEARLLWMAEERAALDAIESRQEEVRRLADHVASSVSRHTSAARSLSSSSRMASIRDSDARSTGAKFRAERAEARISRDRGVASRTLDKARRELAELPRPDRTAVQPRWQGSLARREWVAQFRVDELLGGAVRVLGETSIALRRDDRVWLRGPNGCGKTTLLRRLVDQFDPDSREVLYVPQNLEDHAAPCRARCAALTPEERTRTIELGVALGLAADAILDVRPLSPGELRKLVLALGLTASPALVVLDEPTNDLDLDSVERLENALRSFEGALVVVTHDPRFAAQLELEVWDFPWIEQ